MASYINSAAGPYKLTSYDSAKSNLNADFLSAFIPNGIDMENCSYGECVRADGAPAPPALIQVSLIYFPSDRLGYH